MILNTYCDDFKKVCLCQVYMKMKKIHLFCQFSMKSSALANPLSVPRPFTMPTRLENLQIKQ